MIPGPIRIYDYYRRLTEHYRFQLFYGLLWIPRIIKSNARACPTHLFLHYSRRHKQQNTVSISKKGFIYCAPHLGYCCNGCRRSYMDYPILFSRTGLSFTQFLVSCLFCQRNINTYIKMHEKYFWRANRVNLAHLVLRQHFGIYGMTEETFTNR